MTVKDTYSAPVYVSKWMNNVALYLTGQEEFTIIWKVILLIARACPK